MDVKELTTRSKDVADYLKLIGSPARLLILCELKQGERSVTQLEAAAGLAQSALSQHLARLREHGLVATRREGQTIVYRLADPKVVRLIGVLYDLFCAPEGASSKRNERSPR